MSLKFAKSTALRYANSSKKFVLQPCSVLEVCTVYHQKSRMDVAAINLQRPGNLHILPYKRSKLNGGRWCCKLKLKFAQFLKYKDIQNRGWTLALKICSILETCTVYRTKIQNCQGGRWRYKLRTSLNFAKSTMQRYNNSRLDIGVINLQCICKI